MPIGVKSRLPASGNGWNASETCRKPVRARGARSSSTTAELRLLPYLATHLSLQRIADELILGRETVKGQATSIYRKLAVSSRAAAVAEADRLGLLSETAQVPRDTATASGTRRSTPR